MIWSVSCLFLASALFGKSAGNENGEIEMVLVRNGRPNATIVISRESSQPARFAAKELQYHIQKISGAVLPITDDGQEVTGVRVLVGESASTRALGLRNDDFKSQEYLARFFPDTLVLMGRDQSPLVAPAPAKVLGEIGHSQGKFGQALGFSSNVLILADSGFSDKEGSLEAWVKMTSATGIQNRIIFRIDGGNPWTYHIIQQAGTNRISYVAYDGKTGYCVTSGVLGEGWHHILATHSAPDNKMELFADGISQGAAQYAETACAGKLLYAGGSLGGQDGKKVLNAFEGLIDEIRVSKVVRKASELDLNKAPEIDNQTTLLFHCDEKEGRPANKIKQVYISSSVQPGMFEEQGSCYAVYDFLEKFCGVRWYTPTELGLVYPTMPTLSVKGNEIRRKPAMAYRHPNTRQLRGMGKLLWNHATVDDVALYFCRLKAGGQKYDFNHSFYGYYDRFWKKNPRCPEVFEGEHPEYFAKGWPDQDRPPQLCYTNPELVQQVIRDARDYFDGRGLKQGSVAAGDFFALEPMDGGYYCFCPDCKLLCQKPGKKEPPPGAADWTHFAKGFSSDYWFAFVNTVAREIKKSHPDKFIAAGAYADKACHPGFPLESNVAVQMCFCTRYWECFPHEGSHEKQIYQTWLDDSQQTRRPLYLWLYYNFPEYWSYFGARNKQFYCFPGFFAHTAAQQIKMFARDGIRGVFIESDGFVDPIDLYLTCKLMDDPALDTETALDEFFTGYYGSAAKPMKKLYLAIEETYSNPEYYPEMVRKQTEWQFQQTEAMAWGYLGNEQRMKKFAKLMKQAENSAKTGPDKQRVELFEKGVWDHMLKGRRRYLDKNDPEAGKQMAACRDKINDPEARKQMAAYRDKIKSGPLPLVSVPRLIDCANGDPLKVDWLKAPVLDKWSMVTGYPTDQKIAARLMHDQDYLYLQLEETTDPSKLDNNPERIWRGDDWEVVFSAQRGKSPYRKIAVSPGGQFEKSAYGEDSKEWASAIKVVSNSLEKNKWVVSLAFPLETLLPGGVKTGRKFYANFYRGKPDVEENLAWSPNFDDSFHKLDRLGEFVLE